VQHAAKHNAGIAKPGQKLFAAHSGACKKLYQKLK